MSDVISITHRVKQPGLYTLKDLPQRESVAESALDTGWWELDQIFQIYPGQFTIVTGIPGHGKSTFVLNLLVNIYRKHRVRSYIFAPENEAHLHEKIARIWGDKPGFDEFCDAQWIQSAVAQSHDDPAQTIDWVLQQAVVTITQGGVDILIIDPWNELEWAKRKDQTMTDYISESLKILKYFARIHGVAIIVVAHPTKDVGKDGKARNLTLYDIENSAHWHNKCDNGLIIEREKGTQTTKVISAKVREKGAGRLGTCYFHVDEESEQFTPQQGAVTT